MRLGVVCVALLGIAVATGSAQQAIPPVATKKPAASANKPATKSTARRGPDGKLPAARAAAPKKASANTHTKTTAHTVAAKAATTRSAAPSPLLRTDTTTRAATINRITEALASPASGIEFADALDPLFDRLHQLELDPNSAEVRMLQFGDSHTAADMFTGAMRTLVQGRWGDGGAGYSYPGYPFAGYRIHGTRRAQSVGWSVLGVKLSSVGDAMLGMGGVSLSAAQPGSWISLDADAATLQVQYLIQPGGGAIDVYDNDQLLQTISTDGPVASGFYDATVTPGEHHFEVRTKDYQPVRLFGMVTLEAAGATYEALGLNGAEAGQSMRWNDELAQQLMEQQHNIGLIVLAYGTNEASDSNWTEAGYADMFRRLIEHCRRMAPEAAILVLGPADRELRGHTRSAGWAAYTGIDRIVRAQRTVCRELGCAYWDQRARMGGFGSMRQWVQVQWAQGDHTHFTGEGYTELASALFSDIVQQYNSYESTTGEAQRGAK